MIYLGIKRKWSKSHIAREIEVSPSTVCRKVKRNSKPNGEYLFLYADPKAQSRKHGLKNHSKPDELWWRVEHLLMDEDWSPGQTAGVLSKEGVHICKQTIYNHIHADKSGKLAEHTTHKLKYKRRQSRIIVTKATNIRNRTSIHERPAETDGKRFGDWEMDTIVDSFGHAILTLTERSTNFSNLSNAKTKKIQFKINKRPREKLVFSSPLHAFFSHFD